MRKFLSVRVVALFVVVGFAMFGLSSCGDDDDGGAGMVDGDGGAGMVDGDSGAGGGVNPDPMHQMLEVCAEAGEASVECVAAKAQGFWVLVTGDDLDDMRAACVAERWIELVGGEAATEFVNNTRLLDREDATAKLLWDAYFGCADQPILDSLILHAAEDAVGGEVEVAAGVAGCISDYLGKAAANHVLWLAMMHVITGSPVFDVGVDGSGGSTGFGDGGDVGQVQAGTVAAVFHCGGEIVEPVG